MHDRFLGIDLGTSAVKVLVVEAGGRVAGAAAADYPTQHPEPGWAEQHHENWWRATVSATRRALAAAGPETGRRVGGIGLSGQMHGTVLLGAANDVLAPAIIWADARSAAEARELTERIGAERLVALAGSPLAAGFQAATIRWLQKHRPQLWGRARRVVLPKDYLCWRLTWSHATDPSDASGTLLLDVRTRTWAPELLAALDLDRDLLPAVMPSGTPTGLLRPEAAADLGLPPGLPVATGGGDAPCAALGAGAVDGDSLLVTFSTGAQALLPRTAVETDAKGRLHTFCHVLEPGDGRPGWYTMGATMTAGLALRWLRDNVFALEGEDAFARMTEWAETVPPGANGLIFVPYLIGERTPHMDPRARALYLGLTARHGRAELVRAAIEGAAFAVYDAFLALQELGARPRRIVVAGGGARGGLWRRIVADLFGLPVQRLATADQSAVGAAILGASATGAVEPATAATTWARYGDSIDPDPVAADRYRELFQVYRTVYDRHRDDFAALSQLDRPSPDQPPSPPSSRG